MDPEPQAVGDEGFADDDLNDDDAMDVAQAANESDGETETNSLKHFLKYKIWTVLVSIFIWFPLSIFKKIFSCLLV